jgi:biotin carboxyl carrier protein
MKKFKFSIDNNPFEVAVTELENGQIDVEVNGSNYIVTIDREGTKAANAPAPKAAPVAAPKAAAPAAAPKAAAPAAAPAPAASGAVKTVKSALPGSVTKLVMEVGQAVKKGDTVMMIEAMKMENEIKAECDGTIAKFYVEAGKSVMADDKLFDIACGGAPVAAPAAAAPAPKPAPAPAPKAEPAAAPAAGGPAKALKSPLPGSITKILVTPGQAVKKGETLLMMEAMKMENEIKAEKDGVVAEIKVTVGQNVMNDDVLLTIA